ncbi:MAG: aminoglycoside phosphotransferase family protein [Firmicutes bacterium]|nr:aminoglycoside phosphotransferase family protein [Bacillota bacterium]
MILHLFNREFKLLRRLKSKKNRVYLVESKEGHFVLKLYRAPHHRRSVVEHRVLQEACRKGLAVPQPVAFIEKKALLMEYIPGENLCDLLNRRCLVEYADKLADWYGSFHRCFSCPGGEFLIKGDSILRNFIVRADGSLYGVDFEETAPGDPARDIGQICASILDTDPMFTPAKAALCRQLMTRYGRITGQGNLEFRLTEQVALALRETSRHRPRQRRYLLRQAELLEQEGLAYFLAPEIRRQANEGPKKS